MGLAVEPTEAEWQEQVIQLAHHLGWKHLHVRRSIGKGKRWVTATNLSGWPDLTLFHPVKGGLIFAELKSSSGTVELDQQLIHDQLRTAGFTVYVWRPADLEEVRKVLLVPPGRPYA